MLRLLRARRGWVFVDAPFLREAFVRLGVILYGQAIVLFEKGVYDTRGGTATVLGAGRHLARGWGSERGFATMAAISAFEDDLRLLVSAWRKGAVE